MAYKRVTKDTGKRDDVHVNAPLPLSLHRRLKVKAARENLTIGQALVAAVRAWVRT